MTSPGMWFDVFFPGEGGGLTCPGLTFGIESRHPGLFGLHTEVRCGSSQDVPAPTPIPYLSPEW